MPIAAKTEEWIEVPDGVEITLDQDELTYTIGVMGPKGEMQREFGKTRLQIVGEGGKLGIVCDYPRRKDASLQGTWAAHIRNMVRGVTTGFQYKMKLVYSHFPVKMAYKDGEFVISNFLGERSPRRVKIVGETKVEVKGEFVTLTGINKEDVAQSAANIEQATKIKGYDTRVFQDGIYIIERGLADE